MSNFQIIINERKKFENIHKFENINFKTRNCIQKIFKLKLFMLTKLLNTCKDVAQGPNFGVKSRLSCRSTLLILTNWLQYTTPRKIKSSSSRLTNYYYSFVTFCSRLKPHSHKNRTLKSVGWLSTKNGLSEILIPSFNSQSG